MKKLVHIQEKAIDEIIKRYGEIIDLRKSPYIIVEIAKQYEQLLGGINAAECLPPGGPPKVGDDVVLIGNVLREMANISASINQLHKKIDELKK